MPIFQAPLIGYVCGLCLTEPGEYTCSTYFWIDSLGGYACEECLTEPGQYSCSTLVLDMPIFQAALVAMHAGNAYNN